MPELLISEDMPLEARRQMLKDHADSVEETKYQKPLTNEDLDGKRELLTSNFIQLSNFETELKEIKTEYKGKMEPLKGENKILLQYIKNRQETVEGKIYSMANHHTGYMEQYDEDGINISTRRLRPDEKQASMFSLSKVSGQ